LIRIGVLEAVDLSTAAGGCTVELEHEVLS
jgi:hypothetical protein